MKIGLRAPYFISLDNQLIKQASFVDAMLLYGFVDFLMTKMMQETLRGGLS